MASGPFGGPATRRTTLTNKRKPVRQVHRPKKNHVPRSLPVVSPKSLRMLSAEQFWNQNPIKGQRYIKGPNGKFINEYNLYTLMLPNLLREQNTRASQTYARHNEAARRIQQAWRHTKPTLTPNAMRKMYILQMLFRTSPAFRNIVHAHTNRNKLFKFETPSNVVKYLLSRARSMNLI